MHVDLEFFGYIQGNSTGESHSKSTFIFLKYLCTNLHYGWNGLNQSYENAHLSIFSPTFGSVLLMTAFLIGVRCKSDAILIGISLKNKHFSCLLIICVSSFEKCLLNLLAYVFISLISY